MADSSDNDRSQARAHRAWLSAQGRTEQHRLFGVVIFGYLSSLFIIVQLSAMAWLVSAVAVDNRPFSTLTPTIALLFAAITLRALCHGLREHLAAASSVAIRQRVREQLLHRWFSLGPARQTLTPAEQSSQWIAPVESLHGYYSRYLPQQWLALIVPLTVVAVVLWLDWLAALFLLLSAPLIPMFMAIVGMGAERLNQQHFQSLTRLSGQFLDQLRGLTTLQLFSATPRASQRLADTSDEYRRLTMGTLRLAFLSSAVLEFFSSVAIAVIAIYVGFGLLGYIDYGPADQLTLFSGLLVLLLAPEFFQPLRTFAQHYHDRAAALGAAAELAPHGDTSNRATDRQPMAPGRFHTPVAAEHQAIEVQAMSFSFTASSPLLVNIDVTVPRGTWLGVRGVSGGGKSTLLHLLAGFLTPTRGQVLLFGHPPSAVAIGWLSQTPFVLQGSWADNLRWAAPDASDDALWHVLERLGLDHVVAQRGEGLAAPLSDTGMGLSGGQLRRLALARLLLADYPVVILDEPTTGLDPESAVYVQRALAQLKTSGTTVVVASHDEQLLKLADQHVDLGGADG